MPGSVPQVSSWQVHFLRPARVRRPPERRCRGPRGQRLCQVLETGIEIRVLNLLLADVRAHLRVPRGATDHVTEPGINALDVHLLLAPPIRKGFERVEVVA